MNFADLNLSHREGAAVLYRRLKGAAEAVCGAEDISKERNLGGQAIYSTCWRSALAAAVREVNEPAMSAVYVSKNNVAVPGLMLAKAR